MGFITALLLAAQPIKSLGTVTTATLEGLAAAERIYELLDEKPTVVDRPGRAAARRRAGRHRLRRRELRLRRGGRQAGGAELLAHRARRQDGGAGRPLGRRQVDASSIWWRGCSTSTPAASCIDGQDLRDVTLASLRAGDRHRQPGADAVRRHDPRQHRAGPARRQRRRDRRRRQGGRARTSSSWPSRRATTP